MSWQAHVVWDHAKGAEIWDVNGKHYLDWTSGVLVTNVGHAHPKQADAITKQANRLLNCYDFPTPERINLAQKIVDRTPPHLKKILFLTTGSEATDSSMRLVKRYKKKYEILSFWGGFHGRSYGPMSVCGNLKIKKDFGPMLPGGIFAPYPYCYRCPFEKTYPKCEFYCVKFLDRILETESCGNIGGLMIEPYQGAAGFIFPPEGYLKKLEEWARKNDILFILDEVQSAFGRTGKMFALEHEKLEPDLLCLGKGIGSGIPISALLARSEIFDALDSGEMSSTSGGNPLSCAGALAVLEIIDEENLLQKAEKNGNYFGDKLRELKKTYEIIGDVRGKGMVFGIEIVKNKETKEPAPDLTKDIVLKCVEKGLMVGKLGLYGNVIRVAPPLIITPDQIDLSVSILEKAIAELNTP